MSTATANVSFVAQGWSDPADATIAAVAEPPRDPQRDQLRERLRQAEQESQTSAAVLDLVARFARADGVHHACLSLANDLAEYFGCTRVAIGLIRKRGRDCRLIALSGQSQFDPRSEFVRSVEAALEECRLRGSKTVWPAHDVAGRHATLAHQRIASLAAATSVVSVPLFTERDGGRGATSSTRAARERGSAAEAARSTIAPAPLSAADAEPTTAATHEPHAQQSSDPETVGVLLFLGTGEFQRRADFRAFLRLFEQQFGRWLELARRAELGPVRRFVRIAIRRRKSWQIKAALGAAAAVAAILAWPLPYKIKCECQVQPVTRRFLVAPFDGRLEKSLVKQGDLVTQGQVVARLEGLEIRWELAGLVAERNRAGKQRDSAMASAKTADAQAAKLEMERLDLKIQLLEHRAENLEIRSPIDGVVVSGDLDRAEGAPLSIGDSLFEVAPLEKMLVEVAVPEDEILFVRDGLGVSVRFDAQPGHTRNATLARIHPRAEIRRSHNVFVAELSLDNPDGQLRPGMNGRAKITSDPRALGWNLFHKPAEWFARKLGW